MKNIKPMNLKYTTDIWLFYGKNKNTELKNKTQF
jgi:hypothetical protein